MVARPAARRLRTQLTSPQGAQTQRLPEISMTATAVVRGRPLFRPRMVTSRLGPSGTPAANRNWRIRPKNLTLRGTRAALTIRLLISWLLLVPIRSAFHTGRRTRRRGRDRRLDELEPSAGDHGEIARSAGVVEPSVLGPDFGGQDGREGPDPRKNELKLACCP